MDAFQCLPQWLKSNCLVNTIVSCDYNNGVDNDLKDSLKTFRDKQGFAEPGYANLYTSDTGRGTHYALIDIDEIPVWISTSSNGNKHLAIGKDLSFDAYLEILDVLAKHEIVQKGYVDATRERGYGSLRLPGLLKGTDDDYFVDRNSIGAPDKPKFKFSKLNPNYLPNWQYNSNGY